MQIGNYTLDQSIDGYTDLTELTKTEAKMLAKTYIGERLFRAPAVEIAGRTWNIVVAALRGGKIYKISAQFMPARAESMDTAFSEMYAFYEQQFGTPQKVSDSASMWVQPFGNVVLDKAGFGPFRCVNLQATSGASGAFMTVTSQKSGCFSVLLLAGISLTLWLISHLIQ